MVNKIAEHKQIRYTKVMPSPHKYTLALAASSTESHKPVLHGVLNEGVPLYHISGFDDLIPEDLTEALFNSCPIAKQTNCIVRSCQNQNKKQQSKTQKSILDKEGEKSTARNDQDKIQKLNRKIRNLKSKLRNWQRRYDNIDCEDTQRAIQNRLRNEQTSVDISHFNSFIHQFKSKQEATRNMRQRCDDIVIYKDYVILIELKNDKPVPDCKAYNQLLSTQIRLIKDYLSEYKFTNDLQGFPFKNAKYIAILCSTNKYVQQSNSIETNGDEEEPPITPDFLNQNGSNSLAIGTSGFDADATFSGVQTIFANDTMIIDECRSGNIIVTDQDRIQITDFIKLQQFLKPARTNKDRV